MVVTWIYKSLAFLAAILGIRWVYRIYAGQDDNKKMSIREFQQFATFITFWGSYVYILYIESVRTTETHVFDGVWLAMVITGLFSALHLEDALEKVKMLIEAMIRLRTNQPLEPPTQQGPPDPQAPENQLH